MLTPTPADVAAWSGAAEASAPYTAALAATLTIDTSAFAGTTTADRMQAILAEAREQLIAEALRGFRFIGGQAAERHIATRRGVDYPA